MPPASPLIGRTEELARLRGAFGRLPGAVLVGGEAGIGKTRLVREFTASSAARVLTGGCVELSAELLPFAPFTAALRGLVRELGREGFEELLPGARGLARLLPELGDPDEVPADEARARLFELVLTLLDRLAEREPLVLVIEDAHWADRSSRDLLDFLVRNLVGRVLVLITYRSEALHRDHPLRPLLAELDRIDRVERLELRRLTPAETRRMLGERTMTSLAREVFRRSEGNPLFVEALAEARGELPESLRDLLLAGVRRLPAASQEVLRVAAVGGQRLEEGLLAAVTGLDGGSLDEALRPAVAANTLAVDGEGYVFRHALIREAVREDLLPGELRRLHLAYARTLEESPWLVPPGRATAELAHHWHAARDLRRALESAWQASGEAMKAAAYAEAHRLTERVLKLSERVPAGPDRVEVLLRAVTAAELAGEFDRGVELAGLALERVTERETRMGLLGVRGRMRLHLHQVAGLDDLREAPTLLPDDPPTSAKARALAALAKYLYKIPDTLDEAWRAGEDAVRIARLAGDATAEASALMTLALGRQADGESLVLLEKVEPLLERCEDYSEVLRHKLVISHVLEGAGRHEEAHRVARSGQEDAASRGLGIIMGTILAYNTAEPLVSLGRWDEALRVIEAVNERHPINRHLGSLRALAGEVHTARGDLARAAAGLHFARSVARRGPVRRAEDLFAVLRLEVALRLAEGAPDLAREAAEPVLEPGEMADDARYAWPVLALVARACRNEADLAPYLERAGATPVAGPVMAAHRLVFEAECAPLTGVRGPSWAEAAEAWREIGQPYQEAYALLRAAAEDRGAAAGRLERARSLAAGLGAAPLLAEIERARSRTGGATGVRGLTARETEVLRELAEGRANREIARRLSISAKTVSVHVSNILGKLEVSSRGEAAALARRLGL